MTKHIELLLVPYDSGHRDTRTGSGPGRLLEQGVDRVVRFAFEYAIANFTVNDGAFWFNPIDLVGEPISMRGQGVVRFNGRIAMDIYSKPSTRPRNTINALVNDVQGLYQVNIPNQGHVLQEFPEDLVIECQGVVDAAGIRGITVPLFPPKLLAGAMIPRWHRAELMLKALQTGESDLLLLYLLNDQRTHSLEQAEGLLDAWLADPRNERIARIRWTTLGI